MVALKTPLCLLCPFLVKKETVNGIMGNTQGVSRAMKPPISPNKKIPARLLFLRSSSPQLLTGFLISIEGIFIRARDAIPPSIFTAKENTVDGTKAVSDDLP